MPADDSVVTTARSARAAVRLATWALAAGRPVVLCDGQHADLVLAAHDASAHRVAFVVRHSSGFLTAALPAAACDRLELPPMRGRDGDPGPPDLRVSVDAAAGISTGISAADRARTLSMLADPSSRGVDFCRPGHVVVQAVHADGVLGRPGRAEAAVDLARAAGLPPVAGCAALVGVENPLELADDTQARAFARDHDLVVLDVADVVERRAAAAIGIVRTTAVHPLYRATTRAIAYRSTRGSAEHVALVAGSVRGGVDVPVHIHRECLGGDVFGSAACGCRARLDAALVGLGRCGVLVYVRADAGVTDCSLFAHRSDGAEAEAVAVGIEVLRDLGVRTALPLAGSAGRAALLALGGTRHVPDNAWDGGGASPAGRSLPAAAGSDYWGVG